MLAFCFIFFLCHIHRKPKERIIIWRFSIGFSFLSTNYLLCSFFFTHSFSRARYTQPQTAVAIQIYGEKCTRHYKYVHHIYTYNAHIRSHARTHSFTYTYAPSLALENIQTHTHTHAHHVV